MRDHGHFIGSYGLFEPNDWDGTPIAGFEPDDFLIVPDKIKPFSYVDATGKVIVTIDRPFITDGATTPWFLQIFRWLRRYGMIRKAAFLHDEMWVAHHLGEQLFGFFKSNRIFRDMCRVCGLNAVQAWICWSAITVFGWHMWLRKSKRRAQAHACVNLGRTLAIRKGLN